MAVDALVHESPASPVLQRVPEANQGHPVAADGENAGFRFSQDFWHMNADLLPLGVGIVAGFGISKHGELQIATQPTREVVTLAFDGSKQEDDLYAWEMTNATKGQGRVVSRLTAQRQGMTAIRRTYDVQGKARSIEEVDAEELAQLVEATVSSEFVQAYIGSLWQRRSRMRAELDHFAIEGLKTLGQKKYEQELATRQKHLRRSGFVLWAMQL
jgi:hypothetical protein